MLSEALSPYRYLWPQEPLRDSARWQTLTSSDAYVRSLPEDLGDLAADSRWPAFFPSPICLVTTADKTGASLEKVVGASIVNRFPYVVALSFCRHDLSQRHHPRTAFTDMLERGGSAAIQYLSPGPMLDSAMCAIGEVPEEKTRERIGHSCLATRKAITNDAPVFADAYMVYEASLVKPKKDFDGQPIYATSWMDVGSHRVYFLEINAIQLRQDIADGRSQIHWRGLPAWQPESRLQGPVTPQGSPVDQERYRKGYTPNYAFPSAGTIAFEANGVKDGMAYKLLPPLPEDQVEVENDRARWPCFFPSSVGMITTWMSDGRPNVMPCGSTTIVSRHPIVITPCVSYAAINVRYAPRATLETIRRTRRFGCGVPFIHDSIVNAIRYIGNTSIDKDPDKVRNAGLEVERAEWAPILTALPIHFECAVVGEVRLGTHIMFLGEVKKIRVRPDVTPQNPIEWFPWADVRPTNG